MTNQEIANLVFETLHNIYDVRQVSIEDVFTEDENKKPYKVITIRHKDKYSESVTNDLLASFQIAMNADEDLIKLFVCSTIETDLLEEKFGA